MNAELFDAVVLIEKERGIPREYMHEKIAQALITAFRKVNSGITDNVRVELNEKKKEVHLYVEKQVVETVEQPALEIALPDARQMEPGAAIGDVLTIEVPTSTFGRIAAQTAKQMIMQGMREAERGMVYQEYTSKEQDILTAQVLRHDSRSGALVLEMGTGNERTEVLLTPGEQAKGEFFREGDRLKVYVVEVRKSARGPQILVSRTHPGLVKKLFELEVPEIKDGLVEIRSIAREPGSRTKMAVWANDSGIDPRGACIGPKSQRVNAVVSELQGEKIDIVLYSDDAEIYIAQALAPAMVIKVMLSSDSKSCRVVVPNEQLSLAIGKEGQNARLAARLTGYKIDIKPQTREHEEYELF
ncbi:MAG: transcription termination factor NusA [Oscillospiraceae bacterium]|jgi:N utilization substance protein A|nr:transcription termination factor NusA [Oscillospiraceae bacterium]